MKIGRNEPCPCGSGKKYKKCCLLKEQKNNHTETDSVSTKKQLIQKPNKHFESYDTTEQKIFINTVTGEIYQPVRLYYKIIDRNAVQNIFKKLRCMEFDWENSRWVWLYIQEAKKIVFPIPYKQIHKHLHPIVIGSFFTKSDGEMYLDIRSIERAFEAILFFDRYIDRSVAELTHASVLNRLPFDKPGSPRFNFNEFFCSEKLEEKSPDQFMNELEEFSKIDDINEKREKAFRFIEEKMSEKLPEAEKFLVNFYDDGIDQFKLTLRLRQKVAIERWQGNENVSFDNIMNKVYGVSQL
jgi:hypothetical protein